MRTRRRGVVVSIALAFAALAFPARAEDPDELVAQEIHSSLPLYGFDWDNLWPRSFSEGDAFGCAGRVRFGDWRFTPAAPDAEGDVFWARFSNYGVFHCAAVIRTEKERAALDAAKWRYGFFVMLGTARLRGQSWELWALQQGTVPGSDYLLLAREATEPGLVDRFRVLQQRCPRAALREARNLDVWRTRYCAIDSRADLLALARRMLRLPPRGTLARVAGAEEETEGEDPPDEEI